MYAAVRPAGPAPMMTTCFVSAGTVAEVESLIVGGGGRAEETEQKERIEPGHVGSGRVHFPNGGANAGDGGQQGQARLGGRARQPAGPRQRAEIKQEERCREIGLPD